MRTNLRAVQSERTDITSDEDPASVTSTALVREANRLEEGVLHYEESHRQAASKWRRISDILGFGSAATAATTVALNFPDNPEQPAVAAFAIATTLLASANAFFRPADRESAHRAAHAGFNSLRGSLRRFRTLDIPSSIDAPRLTLELKALATRRDDLVKTSPHYPNRDFEKARRRIADGVFEYAADKDAELAP